MVIPTASRKPYEEMRPASNIKGIIDRREKIKLEDVKPYEKSTSRQISRNEAEARVATAKILRQAMSREEPRMHSRIEQLKILINEKMTEPQHTPRINLERKNSDG